MAKGGARPGAGRKKGGQNAKTAAIAHAAASKGITPLEYMLDILRQEPPPDADAVTALSYQAMRFEAAKAAAPYVHPRLAAHEVKGTGDNGEHQHVHRIEMVIVDAH